MTELVAPKPARHPMARRTTRYGLWESQGWGWGGPARGAGGGSPPKLIPGLSREKRAVAAVRSERREVLRDELVEVLYDLTMNGRTAETQLAAANALLNLIEGPPKRRTVTYTEDHFASWSDEELVAEARRHRAQIQPPEDEPTKSQGAFS